MDEYCSKMTEHISKITKRYIKMAYSKHKMTERAVKSQKMAEPHAQVPYSFFFALYGH
jgi:hypothetical protein